MTKPCANHLPAWLDSEKLSLETTLLIFAARVSRNGDAHKWARALSSNGVDWDDLLRQAARHAITPSLYRFLHDVCPDTVPQEILNSLRQSVWDNTRRNLKLTGELVRILDLFAAQGISAIPFKGPALAALAYGDLAWRQFGDLDILVDKQDVAKASNLLKERGYRTKLDWVATQDETFLEVTYTLEFQHEKTGDLVELHWELFPKFLAFGFSYGLLRQHLVPTWPGGKQMMTFAPEELLLYLCAHGAKHCWANLGWIVDVAWLTHQYRSWNWDLLIQQARAQKIERILLLGLLLAHDLLGASIPAEVEQQIRADESLQGLAAKVGEQLLLATEPTHSMAAQLGFYFSLQSKPRDKVNYIFRLVTNPNVGDWELLSLPARLSFLYAVLRPVRLIKKYVWAS